nr:hypothetical protein PC_1229 [Pleurotus citrinopileatus]
MSNSNSLFVGDLAHHQPDGAASITSAAQPSRTTRTEYYASRRDHPYRPPNQGEYTGNYSGAGQPAYACPGEAHPHTLSQNLPAMSYHPYAPNDLDLRISENLHPDHTSSPEYRINNLSTLAALSTGLGHAPDSTRTPNVQPAAATSPSSDDTPTDHISRIPPASKSKKRRPKPKIELAPDQPPTTQGKPRARVYVACVQCRQRKTRCDGAKPICHNCSRREDGGIDCSYDAQPKRRGPDKEPGARQRHLQELPNEEDSSARRRRRRTDSSAPYSSAKPSTARSESQDNSLFDEPTQRAYDARISVVVPSLPLHAAPDQPVNEDAPAVPSLPSVPPIPLPDAPSTHLTFPAGVGHAPPLPQLIIPPVIPFSYHPPLTSYESVASSSYAASSSADPAVSVGHYAKATTSYFQPHNYAVYEEHKGEPVDRPHIMAAQPSILFSKKIWWDTLLSLYHTPEATHLPVLTNPQRDLVSDQITRDLRFLFRTSNYWFSFFHLPTFFAKFCNPDRRHQIQPSLVLALLSIGTFWQSSEVERGAAGRARALRLREEAQKAMDASLLSGWVDESLAQAAWLLALFEVCAHPHHSTERSTSSMLYLDSLIRSMALTVLDAEDPTTTHFPPGDVPRASITEFTGTEPLAVQIPLNAISRTARSSAHHRSPFHPQPALSTNESCSCNEHTLSACWPDTMEHVPLWAYTPAWDNSWDDGQITRESCRRLCWSAMTLAAGHMSYTTATKGTPLDLFIADPSNYAILFNGESILRSPYMPASAAKDTIWALHDRTFLLWHSCMRMRGDPYASNAQKAQFAISAWLEADLLEQALSRHTCNLERAYIFQGREYLFNTRMCVSYEFSRYIPLVTSGVTAMFNRNKAEEWLRHQSAVARRVMHGLSAVTGHSTNLLARRPFFVFWFMGQIARALTLWECDNSLVAALTNCKALMGPIDYLTALWPCQEQRLRYDRIRERLTNACIIAGETPPPTLDLSLVFPSNPGTLL